MNYWPMEILSFHYSLSRELWKLCKSECVPKVGNHMRWHGDRGFSAAVNNVLRKTQARPGSRVLSQHQPAPHLSQAPDSWSSRDGEESSSHSSLLRPRVPASLVLSTASITVSQYISIKTTSATKKSSIIFYDNVLLRNVLFFTGSITILLPWK